MDPEAGSNPAASTIRPSSSITVNMTFLSSLSCLLYGIEFVFGLICWAIAASVHPGGWFTARWSFVLFSTVTSWLVTM